MKSEPKIAIVDIFNSNYNNTHKKEAEREGFGGFHSAQSYHIWMRDGGDRWRRYRMARHMRDQALFRIKQIAVDAIDRAHCPCKLRRLKIAKTKQEAWRLVFLRSVDQRKHLKQIPRYMICHKFLQLAIENLKAKYNRL